ncbi:hypothetical protein ACLBWZ_14330 [Brucellaceae bacterium C25G]
MDEKNRKKICVECWTPAFLAFVLFIFALLLLSRPVFLLLEKVVDHFIHNGISQGVATLLGALIGFGALSWQAKAGFKNLAKSQASQAELDRIAREHQQNLLIDLENEKITHSKKSLIAAIIGEISFCMYLIEMNSKFIEYHIEKTKLRNNKPYNYDLNFNMHLRSFKNKTIEENKKILGLLPLDIISDLYRIYNLYENMGLDTKTQGLPIDILLDSLNSQIELYDAIVTTSKNLKEKLEFILVQK